MNRTTNHFDFIRLVAASLVLLSHSYALKGVPETEDPIAQWTHTYFPASFFGVQFFFLISGYLILASFERSSSLPSYFWKRSLRIFPGLAVLLLVMVGIYGPIFTNLTWSEYFSKPRELALFLRNIFLFRLNGSLPGVFPELPRPFELVGSLWTLAYEFSCYILLAIWGTMGLLRWRWLTLSFYLILTFLNCFPQYLGNYTLPIVHFPLVPAIQFTSFFIGGMVYRQWADRISFARPLLGSAVLLVGLSFFLGTPYWMYLGGFILVPYLVFGCAFLPGPLTQIGRWGDFSYGLYIYGFPVQQACVYVSNNTLSFYELFFVSLCVTLPIAYFSWHGVEARFLRYKDWIQ